MGSNGTNRSLMLTARRMLPLLIATFLISFVLVRWTELKKGIIANHTLPHLPHLFPVSDGSMVSRSVYEATASCETCIRNPDDELCVYGLDSIHLSRAYEGSGYRIRKVLEKALRGEVVKIGVIGASVTIGHGMPVGSTRWHDRFFQDFKRMFPNAEIHEGLFPGQFFSYCSFAVLSKDLDMYLLELDINNSPYPDTYVSDDSLFRALMGLPQEPAVLRASVFAMSFKEMARGYPSALLISHYFDVPVIGIRNFLLPHIMSHSEAAPKFFSKMPPDYVLDLRHISEFSHQALGDMVSLYIRKEVCETHRRAKFPPKQIPSPWPPGDSLGKIPRMQVFDNYLEMGETKIPPVTPLCVFAATPNKTVIPVIDPPLSWSILEWNDKIVWSSNTVSAKISFEFIGTTIGVFYWETPGKLYKVKPGRIGCWVDQDTQNPVVVDAFTTEEAASSAWAVIKSGMNHGTYTLTCQVLHSSSTGDHEFRMFGIASH